MSVNNKRLARQRQLRNRTIMVVVATAIVALIIIIMAISKGNIVKKKDSNASNTESSSKNEADDKNNNNKDKTDKNNGNEDNNTDGEPDSVNNNDGDTSTDETGEQAGVVTAEYLKYLNYENPDLTKKGDDYYNTDMFIPASVTDDAYFDTALLIGDSRTEGLGLYCGLSNLDIIAAKGLTIDSVMDEPIATSSTGEACTIEVFLSEKKYDNIYISFGLNELGWYYYEVFIDEYRKMIDTIRTSQPNATIYVENILPVSAALSEQDEVYNNPNVDKLNQMTKELCQSYKDVIYLDVASSVKVDGVLPADASSDGRHCNVEYCNKWMDYIRNNVYIKKTN